MLCRKLPARQAKHFIRELNCSCCIQARALNIRSSGASCELGLGKGRICIGFVAATWNIPEFDAGARLVQGGGRTGHSLDRYSLERVMHFNRPFSRDATSDRQVYAASAAAGLWCCRLCGDCRQIFRLLLARQLLFVVVARQLEHLAVCILAR